jgi:hypothetical protein
MSTYTPEELLRKWMQGDLTPEQAIGQLVQHIHSLQERCLRLERCLAAGQGCPKKS